mmetsp:Transcript_9868/g.11263  ORF Transcript_9868/g.11263 Transcript_9868/m.11263 type:complete len:291 (-) Transcript_9868:613-1485(-)
MAKTSMLCAVALLVAALLETTHAAYNLRALGYSTKNQCTFDGEEVHSFDHSQYDVPSSDSKMWETDGFKLVTTVKDGKVTVAQVENNPDGHTFTADKACSKSEAASGKIEREYTAGSMTITLTLTCSDDRESFEKVKLLVPDYQDQESSGFCVEKPSRRVLSGGYPVKTQCEFVFPEVHNFAHQQYEVDSSNTNMWKTDGFHLKTTVKNDKITVAQVSDNPDGHTFTANKACTKDDASTGVITRQYTTGDIAIQMKLMCAEDLQSFTKVTILVPDYDEQPSTGFCVDAPN